MIEIPKWPAVIFTSYRTGSSAFAQELANQNPGVKFFNEPAYHGGTEMEEFTEAFDTSNYVVKIMGDTIVEPYWAVPQHPDYMIQKMLSDKFYKIKLYRRDVIKQIASYHLAKVRNQWGYFENEDTDSKYSEALTFDLQKIKRSIEIIKYNNKIIDNIETDITLYYEDLGEFENQFKITPKPSNYDMLLNAINTYYPLL